MKIHRVVSSVTRTSGSALRTTHRGTHGLTVTGTSQLNHHILLSAVQQQTPSLLAGGSLRHSAARSFTRVVDTMFFDYGSHVFPDSRQSLHLGTNPIRQIVSSHVALPDNESGKEQVNRGSTAWKALLLSRSCEECDDDGG